MNEKFKIIFQIKNIHLQEIELKESENISTVLSLVDWKQICKQSETQQQHSSQIGHSFSHIGQSLQYYAYLNSDQSISLFFEEKQSTSWSQEEIEKYYSFLENILNTVSDPIFVKDHNHKWIMLNDAFCEFMGHHKSNLLGKSDYDFFPKEEADIFWEKDREVFKKGTQVINEESFTNAKGEKHTIVTKKSLFKVQNPDEVYLVGIIRDITEHKKLVKELKASQFRYKTLADYTYNWEYWIDQNESMVYMSPSVRRITGYTVSDFKKDKDLINKIVLTNDKLIWENHRKETHHKGCKGKNHEIEYRIRCKDESIKWIAHVCRQLFDEKKQFIGMRVSNRDITPKVEAEKKLLNLTVEIEEKERNRYSRDIHDRLGPLLSTIKLYFQWLAETDDIEKAKMITEKGNQNLELAIQATREIAYNMSSRVLNKSGFVAALGETINQLNETGQINISFRCGKNHRFGKLEETALYYICTELINNTFKYAQAKNIFIRFDMHSFLHKLVISYKDDGIGFKFEGFEASENHEGLGLWNIYQRVKTFRGKIKLNSSPGLGVQVYIELPL